MSGFDARCTARRRVGALAWLGAAAVAFAAGGCSDPTTQAYEVARSQLDVETVNVLDCLTGLADRSPAPEDRAQARHVLAPCLWEGLVDTPDSLVDLDRVRVPDWPETLASLMVEGGRMTVHVMVLSSGGGQVGVQTASAEMATCFTATLDLAAHELVDVGPTPCRGALVDGRQIERIVPFDEIDLTVSTETLHQGN